MKQYEYVFDVTVAKLTSNKLTTKRVVRWLSEYEILTTTAGLEQRMLEKFKQSAADRREFLQSEFPTAVKMVTVLSCKERKGRA